MSSLSLSGLFFSHVPLLRDEVSFFSLESVCLSLSLSASVDVEGNEVMGWGQVPVRRRSRGRFISHQSVVLERKSMG